MSRHGFVTWLGLGVVLAAAAVLSFAALRDLATAVRIHAELAWLLPIAVDAGAAVSCSAWLSPNSSKEVAEAARREELARWAEDDRTQELASMGTDDEMVRD